MTNGHLVFSRAGPRGTQRRQPPQDLLVAANQQHRPTQRDQVTRLQHAHLHRMPVDLGSVGAVEIGENQPAVVFLDLQVKPADPLVIQLDRIVLFATDGERGRQPGKNTPALVTFKNPDCDFGHSVELGCSKPRSCSAERAG